MHSSLKTSRRSFLRTAAFVAPTMTFSALPVLADPSYRISDTLNALWERRQELLVQWHTADLAWREVSARYDEATPPRPAITYPAGFFRQIHEWPRDIDGRRIGNGPQWREAAKTAELFRGKAAERHALQAADAHDEWLATCNRLYVSTGLKNADETLSACTEALTVLESELIRIPANSIRDLAMKAAIVRRLGWVEDETALDLFADIERLSLTA